MTLGVIGWWCGLRQIGLGRVIWVIGTPCRRLVSCQRVIINCFFFISFDLAFLLPKVLWPEQEWFTYFHGTLSFLFSKGFWYDDDYDVYEKEISRLQN